MWWEQNLCNHEKISKCSEHDFRQKTPPEVPQDLSLWGITLYQTLPKLFDIWSYVVFIAPDLLKVVAILPDATVRRSAVQWKETKHEINKNTAFFEVIQNSII